jgi:hypothetical protein
MPRSGFAPLLTMLTVLSGVCAAQEGARVQMFERFDGATALREMAPDGSIAAETGVQVDIRNWMIGGGVRLEELPLERQGLMVVQLRNGEVATIIDGERVERQEGEFWTVPAGARMGLETGDDSAILQTIVVEER